MNNKIAIVTGASSGIGESTARALAKEGVKVVAVARRKDKLEALVKEIEASGGTAWAYEADVTGKKACEELVSEVVKKWGRVDILINNAGVMLLGPAIGAPTDEWEKMIHLNLLGLMYMTHAALPGMKSKNAGHIINISSVAGRTTRSGSAVYNATKWGVNAFTDSLRQELGEGKLNIRTTLIEPGLVSTELISHNRPEVQEAIKGRFGNIKTLQPDDIARSIVYAVSQPDHVNVNEILIRPTEQAS